MWTVPGEFGAGPTIVLMAVAVSTIVAWAEPAPAADCVPATKRPPSAIFVPLTDEHAPQGISVGLDQEVGPRKAVVIEAGESLCLTGTVYDTGEVRKLRPYDAPAEGPAIGLSLRRNESAAWLTITTNEPLDARIVRLPLPGVVAIRDREVHVPARRSHAVRLEGAPQQIALTDIRIALPGPEPKLRPVQPPIGVARQGLVGLYLSAGSRWLDLPELDQRLGDAGYATLPKSWGMFGAGLVGGSDGWLVALEITTGAASSLSPQSTNRTHLRYTEFGMRAGWQVLRLDGFFADVSAGLNVGTLAMNRRIAGTNRTACDDGPSNAGVIALSLSHGGIQALKVSASSDVRMLFGYRLEYFEQLGDPSWQVQSDEASGPKFDVSGVKGSAWLGIGL